MHQFGAREFSFDIDSGWGMFLPAEGSPLDLEELKRSVQETGFELLELELRLRGALASARDAEGGARPAVRVASTGQRFLLFAGDTEAERSAYARLTEWLGDSPPVVEVLGRARAHPGADAGLSVREFRLLE